MKKTSYKAFAVQQLFTLLLTTSSLSYASSVYTCKDVAGAKIFSDVPCHNSQVQLGSRDTSETMLPKHSRKNITSTSKPEGKSNNDSKPSTTLGSEARSCDIVQRRYKEAKNMDCIQGVQGGTGKVMCMPAATRAAFIDNLKELITLYCS